VFKCQLGSCRITIVFNNQNAVTAVLTCSGILANGRYYSTPQKYWIIGKKNEKFSSKRTRRTLKTRERERKRPARQPVRTYTDQYPDNGQRPRTNRFRRRRCAAPHPGRPAGRRSPSSSACGCPPLAANRTNRSHSSAGHLRDSGCQRDGTK